MSQLRDSTTKKDLENITPSIIELVDKWQSKGKFIWSGPLSDEKTGMAIFEATEEEAEEFHDETKLIPRILLHFHGSYNSKQQSSKNY